MGWGGFHEMEMIATANVMRMRRGKRQYRRVCRGMKSLPVVPARRGRIGRRRGGLTKRKRRRRCMEVEAKRTFGFFRADRAQLIITLRPSESSERLTGRRIPLREVTLTKLQRKWYTAGARFRIERGHYCIQCFDFNNNLDLSWMYVVSEFSLIMLAPSIIE